MVGQPGHLSEHGRPGDYSCPPGGPLDAEAAARPEPANGKRGRGHDHSGGPCVAPAIGKGPVHPPLELLRPGSAPRHEGGIEDNLVRQETW